MAAWPTGWSQYLDINDWDYAGDGGDINNFALPEVINNDGDGDKFSLKFSASYAPSSIYPTAYCYADVFPNNFKPCDNPEHKITMQQRSNLGALAFQYSPKVQSNGQLGQKFTFHGRYKYKPAASGAKLVPKLAVKMQFREKNTTLGFRSAAELQCNGAPLVTNILLGDTHGVWQDFTADYIYNADTAFACDGSNNKITQTKPASQVIYDGVRVIILSDAFTGDIQFDNFSLTDQNGKSLPLINGDFSQGHLQNSIGDHAAFFLSRLNGTAYMGSLSHYINHGSALTDSYSSFIKMFRGETLGQATKDDLLASPSGIIYGDPLYSPAAVRIDPLPAVMWSDKVYSITGSARNGLATGKVTLDYCEGTDFFICDKNGSWKNIANSYGVKENTTLFTLTLPNMTQESRAFVLRLQVSSMVDRKEAVLNSFARCIL